MNSNSHASLWGVARITFLCLSLFAFLSCLAVAQETTGSIGGQVTDQSGAAVPNAKIELTGANLPRAITVNSDSSGNYMLQQVPAGVYKVTATASGFSTAVRADVPVTLGRTARADFKLEVGKVTESVVVNADAIMVDTTVSSSAISVDKSFFDLIPKGRGFYDLIALAPGARNEGKGGGYQVDGASGSENTFYLDGMEITNVQVGTLDGKNRIPVEMVQQVQVKNGVMDAQYGGAMGGVVNAVVLSGSNEFHGEAGFYYNNAGMAARPRPSLQGIDPTDATRTKYRYFQVTSNCKLGSTDCARPDDYAVWNPVFKVGGPLIKNKLYFFSGFMPTLQTTNRTVLFLSDNSTKDFSSKSRQHYMAHKLDFAPHSKLRMNASWVWNPNYWKGSLPSRDGTDAPNRTWDQFGAYTAGQILTGQADYLATSKMIISFRGGYNYNNYTDRYASSSLTHIYSNANTMFPTLDPSLRRTAAGWVQQGTSRTDYNIYTRVNLNADFSYLANWHGQHNFKAGWQTNRLSNSVRSLSYPNGYYRYYWDQSYSCITSQCSGRQRGTYGYYRWYTYGTFGDASSDNQGIYFLDNWRVNKHLTLNLGLRTEREFLPSFSKQGIAAAPPIEFSWGEKLSPRIGGAFDPRGDGKMKFYASWGYFYDVMKYEMPRGSFGGDIYLTYYYALDDPTLMTKNQGYPADPKALPGKFFEGIDWRIPSNDPKSCEKQGLSCKGMTIDPNLKPMKQRMMDLGFDYSINPTLMASIRYTNRRLIRTIEDVGFLGPDGEVYWIANPGFGVTTDKSFWDPGFPMTPKAKRDYDAVEFRLDKRFAKNYQFAASYTWSRMYGNYSGLASSDENGRTSPNVNRYFDLPWIGYDEKGKFAEGRLPTDRPHTFKFFGSYTLKSILGHTTISPTFVAYSGTPLTTQLNAISSVPVYPYGRGDMGRTPVFANFDANVMHDFTPIKSKEQIKIRFEFTVFNLFNSSIVTDKDNTLIHPDDGQLQFAHEVDIFKGFNTKAIMAAAKPAQRTSPSYGVASGFQGPRSARLQLSFFF